jgi:hypothetical protein
MNQNRMVILAVVCAVSGFPVSASASSAVCFIDKGSSWKYLDTGTAPPTGWTDLPFDDSAWSEGPAELGYGDDPVTVLSYGPDPDDKYITTWFRKTFEVADVAGVSLMAANLKCDDGAVIFLNGVEVARHNMPAGAITPTTLASVIVSGGDEEEFFMVDLPVAPLVSGANVVAVEVHQASTNSSDLSFDLELCGSGDPASGWLVRGPYLQQAGPTSAVVRWRSSQASIGRVTIGATPGGNGQTFDETSATTDHAIPITGLTPDMVYYYTVGSADGMLAGGDEQHAFTTPPETGVAKSTRIWVLGDPGTGDANQRGVRDAFYGFAGTTAPDLCLLLGDNAYDSGTDSEYQAGIFEVYGSELRKSPFWSCLGNHDTAQSTAFVDTYPYFDIFTFPTAGEAGGVASGTEHYFSFDHGNIHFISLDSTTADLSPGGAMATWLAADLAATGATWIIVIFHHAPYTKGTHDSDTETTLIQMRGNILPILENGGADLVLSGHSHGYERSFLLDGHYGLSGTLLPSMKKNAGDGRPAGDGAYVKPLTGPRDHFGTVYNVTGSAGKVGSGSMDHPAMCLSEAELGSVVLDIHGTRLDSFFIRSDGTIGDSYTILKQGEADSDSDGIPDTYEMANSLDRHDPADAALDADGDGTSNLSEYVFGRPASIADVYAFTVTVNQVAGTAVVVFQTVAGRNYRVEWSESLLPGDWHSGSPPIPGTGVDASWTDEGLFATPTEICRRFYRIKALIE